MKLLLCIVIPLLYAWLRLAGDDRDQIRAEMYFLWHGHEIEVIE